MRGILMIEPLYHQAVAGLKTQTRRSGKLEVVNGRKAVIKKGKGVKPAIETNPDNWELVRIDSVGNAKFWEKNNALNEQWVVPRYAIGEVLYIKEPYTTVRVTGSGKDGYYNLYKYTHPVEHRDLHNWKNKLFMPAEAARAYVRITGIRCERLLDISDEDCVAEGIEYKELPYYNGTTTKEFKDYLFGLHILTAKASFLSLYKFANKVKEIENLWVFVYEFEYLPNYKPSHE